METIIILLVASGLSAGVVWWATAPPGGRAPRRLRPREPKRSINFTETFQTTAPDPRLESPPEDGFVMLPSDGAGEVEEDRPPRLVSTVRIAAAIALVAVLGVAALGIVGLLVKTQLDQLLGGG